MNIPVLLSRLSVLSDAARAAGDTPGQVALEDAIALISARPKVTVQVDGGCVSRVLSSVPNLDVTILDMDARNEGQLDSEDAERNEAELDAEVKAGTLFEVA